MKPHGCPGVREARVHRSCVEDGGARGAPVPRHDATDGLSLVIVSLMWQEGKKVATGSHGKNLEVLRKFSGKVKKQHGGRADRQFWSLSAGCD